MFVMVDNVTSCNVVLLTGGATRWRLGLGGRGCVFHVQLLSGRHHILRRNAQEFY